MDAPRNPSMQHLLGMWSICSHCFQSVFGEKRTRVFGSVELLNWKKFALVTAAS